LILEARGCERSRLGPSCQASSGQGGEARLKRRDLQGWETRLSTFSFDAALDTALLFAKGGKGGPRCRWVAEMVGRNDDSSGATRICEQKLPGLRQ
jgi:hypothetical protein